MKVKMLEYYQGYRGKGIFAPGEVREVNDELGAYLLEHRKAVQVIEESELVFEPLPEADNKLKTSKPKAKPRKKAVKK